MAQMWQLRLAVTRDAIDLERAQPLCATFIARYPHVLRLPFRLTEENTIELAPTLAERECQWPHPPVPTPYQDLAAVLALRKIFLSHVDLVLLLVNREARRLVRRRLVKEVIQELTVRDKAGLERLWLRFIIWERERAVEDGGRTLLYREELAAWLLDHLPPDVCKEYHRMSSKRWTRWFNAALHRAEVNLQQRKRAVLLEATMNLHDCVPVVKEKSTISSTGDFPWATSVEELAAHFHDAPEQVTAWLRRLFTGQEGGDATQRAEAFSLGYFLAMSGDERVLFQVGWEEQGEVPEAVVERAYVCTGRERADRTVILSLAPVSMNLCREADELGVLVLPVEAFDKLLAYHVDRIWRTVEWSLRASRRPEQEKSVESIENLTKVLELGLST